jgi:hypothetical protein
VTGAISDDSPSRTTVCVRFDKKANTYLAIWKATVYYMIFNMASDILDPVKPNYCPLIKNLLQIQIKIFKLISLSWTLPKPNLLRCIFHLFCMLVQHLHVSSQMVCSQSEVIFEK